MLTVEEKRGQLLAARHRERQIRLAPLTRAEASDDKRKFSGHAAVFNQRTYIGMPPWGFFEEIEPGAFTNAINRPDDVRLLINHDANLLLARTSSGTLRLSQDDAGLVDEADLPDTSYARDMVELMLRGDLNQQSFAFWPDDESWEQITIKDEESGAELKADLVRVKDVQLFDVSPVTYPAYVGTDAGVRTRSVRGSREESEIARAIMKAQMRDSKELEEIELRAMELRPAPVGLKLGG